MPGKILVYCHDPTLLETRRLVLSHAGFDVFATSEFDDAWSKAARGDMDLFILGSSLPHQEVNRILPVIHADLPETPVLVLTPRLSHSWKHAEVLNNLAGPEQLISVVRKMVDHKHSKSALSSL